MIRQKMEYWRPSARQLAEDEVNRFFQSRRTRLQRLLADEDLLDEEREKLSLIESELTALSSILGDELARLDDKLIDINKSIATAKATARQ
jgi:Lon protease-like protein